MSGKVNNPLCPRTLYIVVRPFCDSETDEGIRPQKSAHILTRLQTQECRQRAGQMTAISTVSLVDLDDMQSSPP